MEELLTHFTVTWYYFGISFEFWLLQHTKQAHFYFCGQQSFRLSYNIFLLIMAQYLLRMHRVGRVLSIVHQIVHKAYAGCCTYSVRCKLHCLHKTDVEFVDCYCSYCIHCIYRVDNSIVKCECQNALCSFSLMLKIDILRQFVLLWFSV